MPNEQLFQLDFQTKAFESWLVNSLKEEFSNQGHNLTGKLLNSIRTQSQELANGDWEIDVRMLDRYRYTEYGVKASRIPFGGVRRGRSQTGKKSAYIQGLIQFVLLRKMTSSPKKALGIAIAIAKKHKKEGMPTRGSYSYSKNGRRLAFQKTVLAGRGLRTKLKDEWREQVEASIFELIAKLNR